MVNLLPVETILLPNLTHLFGKFMLDKDDLKNVKKMSKVQKFFTDENKGLVQLMNQMKRLRKVKIWCKRAENSSSYISQAIQEFTRLPIDRVSDRSLALHSEEPSNNFPSWVDLEPCSEGYKYGLRALKLHGNLTRLPPFVTLMSGLSELCISSDSLTRDLLSLLATLTRLLYLKLIASQLENFEIGRGALPSLRRLSFVVRSLTSAALPTIEQGALPNLVSLQLLGPGLVSLSGIEIRHLKQLKEITIDSKATVQTRQDWEWAAKKHPNRPRVMLLKVMDPMGNEEPGTCTMLEKRKRTVAQPRSEDGLDSSFKKMRLSEPYFVEVSIDHPSSGNSRNAIIHQYSSSSGH